MHKSIIDNLTDEQVKEIFKKSINLKTFYRNLGYKQDDVGKNTRKKIKERMDKLGLRFENIVKEKKENIIDPIKDTLNSTQIGFCRRKQVNISLCKIWNQYIKTFK